MDDYLLVWVDLVLASAALILAISIAFYV